MKVECLREKLDQAVSKAEKITGKNLTLPILRCVLLVAKESELTIRATNLEIGIEIKIPVKVEQEGVVAVPADVLKSFLNSLFGDKKVYLHADETVLHVTTQNSETKIKTFPYDEFPGIPIIDGGKNVALSSLKLLGGLKSVFYSASVGSMKPELGSIYIYPHDGNLVFVATDSFRLAEKKIALKDVQDWNGLLIPQKNVIEILRIFEENDEDITVEYSENQVAFKTSTTYATSRVIEGNFPDYAQIIPKEFSTEITILKQDLLGALRLSTVFSDKFNQVTFVVDPDNKLFRIETYNTEVGGTNAQIDASITGEAIEMSFNYRYVVDCFQSISSDSVILGMSPGKPMVIRGMGDSSFTYLVMSMNR